MRADGHAVEVRLYAEDAEAGFLPATGRIERLRWPSGLGVRVDAGVIEGDEVTARFDPMLAKVIAHGPDRATALERLAVALDETVVLGLTTNLRFLRWLVRQPVVRAGDARTNTLEAIWPPVGTAMPGSVPDAAWASAAALLAAVGNDPWRGGFRLNAPPVVRLESGSETRLVAIEGATASSAPASASSAPAPGTGIAIRVGETVHVDVDGRSVPFRIAPPPDVDRAARAAAAHHGGPAELVAPMPGQVRMIAASTGAPVEAGATVVILEAMKMEHAVTTPMTGRIAELRVAVGEQVARGQVVAVIEP